MESGGGEGRGGGGALNTRLMHSRSLETILYGTRIGRGRLSAPPSETVAQKGCD